MEYFHMIIPSLPAQRFGIHNRAIFSSLLNQATGCVLERAGQRVSLDLVVDSATHRFEFESDKDLHDALELVRARRLPVSDHGTLVRMLLISIICGFALLSAFALLFQGA